MTVVAEWKATEKGFFEGLITLVKRYIVKEKEFALCYSTLFASILANNEVEFHRVRHCLLR